MNCPICHKPMKKDREDISNNRKKGKEYKEYKRVIYWCKDCDAWLNFETPLI